ncbi:hypothetical protein EUTSA_v10023669mg [Eutrema salsugineum]|uniref:Cystatin domain-containing protein n=1 Tax=Eutrema salsugineum TaxID=72664 RepID=V4KGV1_EUTSA|nr:uncharacterized protein LOC18010243 isoform X2 [Eutrema salsugineum]ESQ29052.1 hypothetical protein EUTSA_v10023669mg [Eutrema salsugineum]ESQ29053.1 hypothetical protein EUTSA_v10023669mg [Eutrema salsugineum]
MGEVEGWTKRLEPAVLIWEPNDHDYEPPSYDPDKAKYTPEEELARMCTQVNQSDGFDIDFSSFRCVFNYHQANFDCSEFVEETNGDYLKSLSQKSLEDYNEKEGTKYEFVKVVKANFHASFAGAIFLITFEVIDPYDNLIKSFQARVCRHFQDDFTEFVFCRPKPNQGSVGIYIYISTRKWSRN